MADETTGLTMIGRAPVAIPEVLDLLVVGAGPGGTAAALRAMEHKLSVLVVDYDDILKRIRDYSKDKLILPDFGGGDAMRFPKGGELVSRLRFAPIDKDEMHQQWKRLYRDHRVPVEVGVELTGLARHGDVLAARLFDHGKRLPREIVCRHLVLAIGRGVPRRFDVPGNTDGIGFRLDDPAKYVGRPVCVIGGGTSAAEAVIAISQAKAKAEDASVVCWSYRGDKLPRVSKALADVFFEAYVFNGNIRYLPHSEPVAVLTGEDRCEYLALRVDRRAVAGRPAETTLYEFPKTDCIACIGEDIPEALLAGMGIHMVTGGPKLKKRMCITPLFETQVQNVYLIGDILSQAYLETDDFSADPATFREVQHRGNVKSALRDGVFVADVVAQKVAGKKEIRVVLQDADDLPEVVAAAKPSAMESAIAAAAPASTPAAAKPAVVATGTPAARLVRLLQAGVEEDARPLAAGAKLTIGRTQGDLQFADDDLLSDPHASLAVAGDTATLRDEGAKTGVFVRARPARHTELPPGGLLRAGASFLLLAAGDDGPVLRQFDNLGKEKGRHPIAERARIFGRDAPDVVLDPADMSLSRRHFAVLQQGGKVLVKDLRSVNGTYLRVKGTATLEDGDELRVGRQSFRFVTAAGEAERAQAREVVAPASPPRPTAPPPAPTPSAAPSSPGAKPAAPTPAVAAATDGAPSVTFRPDGRTFPVRPNQTLCEVAEEHGIKLQAECHAGVCGSDPLRILSGAEHLTPMSGGESETLEELCNLEPGKCRLACMTRVKGPVVVEVVAR